MVRFDPGNAADGRMGATMSYRLTIEKKDDVLWVTAVGTRALEGVLAMTKDVLAALIENKVTKVLVDVRALEGRLRTMESYEIVDKRFPEFRDRSVITRCSIVDLKAFEHDYRFFENLPMNRGFDLRIFPDPDEALGWLQQERTP
jgi:hypothetical protein